MKRFLAALTLIAAMVVGPVAVAQSSGVGSGSPGEEAPVPRAIPGLTITFKKHLLKIVGSAADDFISVECSAGETYVNGLAPLATTLGCSKVKGLSIDGKGGTDTLFAWNVSAGAGFTSLTQGIFFGGPGPDSIYGTDRRDLLDGGPGADDLSGLAGRDVVFGGKGNDLGTFIGSNLKATVEEVIDGRRAEPIDSIESVHLTGTPGDDTLNASKFPGATVLGGSGGNDTLIGSAFADTLGGANGIDTLRGGKGKDLLRWDGLGDDVLNGGRGTDTLYHAFGSAGNVTLTPTSIANSYYSGSATLASLEDFEYVGMGPVTQMIDASAWTGTSFMKGSTGLNTITGGSGNDTIWGNDGIDSLWGGGGIDTAYAETSQFGGTTTLTNNNITNLGDTDTIVSFERGYLTGTGLGVDTLNANSFSGPVQLFGLGGDDVLTGGAANDALDGGDGNDTCNGGAGTNTFVGCESIPP